MNHDKRHDLFLRSTLSQMALLPNISVRINPVKRGAFFLLEVRNLRPEIESDRGGIHFCMDTV
jgi:hypothetical protein